MRQLLKSPGFSLTVAGMLALGIGATTAIFSLVEGILLRPLPFQSPDRLVVIGEHVGDRTGIGVTAPDISTYSAATTAFSSLGGYIGAGFELSGGATPVAIHAARLTASVFPTLGIQPLIGRVFTQTEDDSHQLVAVLSYSLWTDRFHRDPNIAGTPIVLNRKTYTVIGVMPRDFEFPLTAGRLGQAQLWVPMSLAADELTDEAKGRWGYQMVARLKAGVTLAQGAQDADRVARVIMRGFPAGMAAIHIRGDAADLRNQNVNDTRPLLRALFLAVCVVLLIACVNVAILMLVRAIRRRREIAVRLALGARAGVIVRESLFEGMALSLTGGVGGLVLAAGAVRFAVSVLPDSMPRISSIAIDARVAAFALLIALITGVLCSLAPAFAALRTNLLDCMRDSARAGVGGASHAGLRSGLVVVEIAIALVLFTSSLALLRSYQKMLAVDPGYRADHVLVASYQLPKQQYSTDSAVDHFDRAVLDRLSIQPGITAAAIANSLPTSSGYGMSAYTIEGQPAEGWKLKFAPFEIVGGDYFHAMGITLLDGRTFKERDRSDQPLVVIVNESMAKHSWPGERAVGKRMHVGNPKKGYPWATVVGVVADTRLGSRDEPADDQWYCPIDQPAILSGAPTPGQVSYPSSGKIAIRSAIPPEQMVETLRAQVAAIDPHLALDEVQPMTDAVSEIEAPRRFNTGLISGFALGALLLAITGIYAVVAFSVSLRAQEIAIRMALGAERAGIARLVLAAALRLALFGCALGVIGSFAVSRIVSGFLFEVSATDPFLYCISAATMIAVALAASALPAIRAASADPVKALKSM